MSPQLPLPFTLTPKLSRADFIVAPANAEAVAFVDAWPGWAVASAALYGPSGSGKSHLASAWPANARVQSASALDVDAHGPLVLDDVDSMAPTRKRDEAIFTLLERATREAPVLLTGHEHPSVWPTVMPDLASRFSALLAFPLWAPDDALLAALARKLFDDRQLKVPDAVIQHMIRRLERTPAAIRAFVAQADAKALSEKRPVTSAMIQELAG
ncbi:MAG TPA: DnaA/Hda family protein [Rhizomicrobium sp.]|jgi:chromosomal replication initiation ATPase DnaA|nr:DnaA/Hda family protein [Rhizomicrobium sp.]